MGNVNGKNNNTVKNVTPKAGSVYNDKSPRQGYYINNKGVYYGGKQIQPVPGETMFKKLKYSYAKTNKRVFYRGEPIVGADPITFITINRNEQKNNLIATNPLLSKLDSVFGLDSLGGKQRIYYKGVKV
jgi:hypothetical protein